MSYEVNEEKRNKFMEFAGKRVNNVLHDIQILEPMARSNNYDFTRQDVEEMFGAMQEVLNEAKIEFERKFEEKAKAEKKIFSFGQTTGNVKPQEMVFNTVEIEKEELIEEIPENIVEETIEET